MSHPEIGHRDCRNYAPVDVVKGICHRTKEQVMGDEVACGDWVMMPKCKFCECFSTGEEANLGVCGGETGKTFLAYPDMAAVSCRWFTSRPGVGQPGR